MAKIDIINMDDFARTRKENGYYIDKTGFLEKFLRAPAEATLFIRPRLFGKTMFLFMLAEFFDIAKDSRKLFEGLAVSSNRELCAQWMNRYPVICLSLRNVAGRNFADALASFSYRIASLFGHHSEILSSDKISARDRMLFEDIINKSATEAGLRNSLKILTRILTEYYQKQPIVLVDDYDAPIARAAENGYYDEMLDFLHGFLSAGLKTNWDNLKFGIITGRLHIPLQSGLNNLDVDDLTTTCRYADVFGFTQGEVDKLLCDVGFSEKREVFRDWYGGYRLGDKTEVYSPWSTMQYLRDLQAYPTLEPESNAHDSSQSFFIKKLFPDEYLEMAAEIANLVLGGVLLKRIPRTSTYKNLDFSANLWAVLYQCGCLTRASKEQLQSLDVSPNPARDEMALVIPNEEIRTVFWYTVSTWYRDTVDTEQQRRALLDAFWQADTEGFRNKLHAILLKNVKRSEAKASALSAKALSENFFHGLLAGFFLVGCPQILSFTEVSDRSYDLQVLDNRAGRAAIVEVRRAFDEREDLLRLAETGLKQIEKNRNNARLLSDSSVKTLLHWSIAFCKKRCEAKALILKHP